MWNKNYPTFIQFVAHHFVKKHVDKINPKLRRMSWKQCRAIQGFPNNYEIIGNDVKSKYRQIGNAVPPPLMEQVALQVKKSLSRVSN